MHTQFNESLHHVRNFFAPKNNSFRFSYSVRIYLLVLYWNLGPIYFKNLYESIVNKNITDLLKTKLEKTQKRWEKHKKIRNTNIYRKKSNDKRIKRKNELRKTTVEGHITANNTDKEICKTTYRNKNEDVSLSKNFESNIDGKINFVDSSYTEEYEEEYSEELDYSLEEDTSESLDISDDLFEEYEERIIEFLCPSIKLAGIKNPGNLCYSISVIQLWTTNEEFINRLIQLKDPIVAPFVELYSRYIHETCTFIELPPLFLDYIVQFSESISKQADAEEFLNAFISKCEHNKLLNNILLHDYQTTVVYTFTCTNCQNESVKEESDLIIYLNLNSLNEIDMNQLILLNKKGNVKKICENCKKNTKHETEIIHLYSKYILYVVKRYDMLGNKIEVPLNILNVL